MGEFRAPKLVRAELFAQTLMGQSRALLVNCRSDDDDQPVDCITKLDARLKFPPTEHLREWLGCAVGNVMGINVPDAYRVEIRQDFADGLPPDDGLRADAKRSLGIAFGCSVFRGGTQWVSEGGLPPELRERAAELLAFDMFIHNLDRRATNPNVFVDRDDVWAFDHGEAFSFIFPNFGAPPPAVDPLTEVADRHVFRSALRGIELPLTGFHEGLAALTDDVLSEIEAVTPPEWQAGPAAGKLKEILDLLRARRDAVNQWLPILLQKVHR